MLSWIIMQCTDALYTITRCASCDPAGGGTTMHRPPAPRLRLGTHWLKTCVASPSPRRGVFAMTHRVFSRRHNALINKLFLRKSPLFRYSYCYDTFLAHLADRFKFISIVKKWWRWAWRKIKKQGIIYPINTDGYFVCYETQRYRTYFPFHIVWRILTDDLLYTPLRWCVSI